jgi:hypothetical protein
LYRAGSRAVKGSQNCGLGAAHGLPHHAAMLAAIDPIDSAVGRPLVVRRRLIRRVAYALAGAFVAISFTLAWLRIGFGHDRVFGLSSLLDLNGEANVPAWYSGCLLFADAVAAAIVGVRLGGRRGVRWLAIAAWMTAMSLDEIAAIHERLTVPAHYLGPLGPIHNVTWVFAGMLVTGAVVGLFLRSVLAMPAPIRRGVLLAGAIYVGGALGMEALGGVWALQFGEANMVHAVIDALEEGGELVGATMFLNTALLYLEMLGPTELRVDGG